MTGREIHPTSAVSYKRQLLGCLWWCGSRFTFPDLLFFRRIEMAVCLATGIWVGGSHCKLTKSESLQAHAKIESQLSRTIRFSGAAIVRCGSSAGMNQVTGEMEIAAVRAVSGSTQGSVGGNKPSSPCESLVQRVPLELSTLLVRSAVHLGVEVRWPNRCSSVGRRSRPASKSASVAGASIHSENCRLSRS